MKPAMGFKLPWAGVTPAPSEKKSRNVEDAIPLSGSFEEARGGITSPVTLREFPMGLRPTRAGMKNAI